MKLDKVTLREFEEKDIPLKVQWINNPANNKYLHYDLPLTIDGTKKWFISKDNTLRRDFVIEYGGDSVGVIGLINIDWNEKSAEFYITVGDVNFCNLGIGTQASRLLIDFAFFNLNLDTIWLNVDMHNVGAVKLYNKIGFVFQKEFIEFFANKNNSVKRQKMELKRDYYKKDNI